MCLVQWDPDSDFAILRHSDFNITDFVAEVQRFQGDKYTVQYMQHRQLIQIRSRASAQVNADIWLWAVNGGRIHNNDYTNSAKSRLLEDVVPVRAYAWMGYDTMIPRHADSILDAEYGGTWRKPFVTR